MKKAIFFMVFFVFLFAIFQFFANSLKRSHDIFYGIGDKQNLFVVNEKYDMGEYGGYYFFEIRKGANVYNFDIDDYFNKQRGVIKDIYYVEKNGTSCVYPVFIDEKYSAPISCFKDKKQLSLAATQDINIEDFKQFRIDDKIYEDSPESKELKNTYYYINNINKNEYFYFYKYSHLDLFSKDNLQSLGILEEDNYHNKMGRLIGEYFVTAKYVGEELTSYKGYSIIDRTILSVAMPRPLSKSSWVLGIIGKKLYILDPINKLEVEIDFNARTSKIVNKDDIGYYFDGLSFSKFSVQKMINEGLTFKKQKSNVLNQYDPVVSYSDDKAFYYLAKDGTYYKVYKGNIQNPIILFNKKISNVIVSDGNIYFREGDTIYRYDGYNIKKLIKYADLVNNNYHIYGVYNKREKRGIV